MMTLRIGRRMSLAVANLPSASREYQRIRDESGEGCSTFPEGIVKGPSGIYRIRYNGRIWLGGKRIVGAAFYMEAADRSVTGDGHTVSVLSDDTLAVL